MDIPCRRATELAEQRLHSPLSLADAVRFRFHNSLCAACRRYAEQSLVIERLLRQHTVAVPDPLADGNAAEALTETILKKLP
ncbi:MAG: hypothetical protein HUU02_05840 [Bacteroidetes bacterium]|nr:hypothetical protein [Bacteroidota bacterium]